MSANLARRIELLEGGSEGPPVDIAKAIMAARQALVAGALQLRTHAEMVEGAQQLRARAARRLFKPVRM